MIISVTPPQEPKKSYCATHQFFLPLVTHTCHLKSPIWLKKSAILTRRECNGHIKNAQFGGTGEVVSRTAEITAQRRLTNPVPATRKTRLPAHTHTAPHTAEAAPGRGTYRGPAAGGCGSAEPERSDRRRPPGPRGGGEGSSRGELRREWGRGVRAGRAGRAARRGAGGHSPIWAPRGRASPARSSTSAAIAPSEPKGTEHRSWKPLRPQPFRFRAGGRRRGLCCSAAVEAGARREAAAPPEAAGGGRPRRVAPATSEPPPSSGCAKAQDSGRAASEEMPGPILKSTAMATADPGAPHCTFANEKSLYEGGHRN